MLIYKILKSTFYKSLLIILFFNIHTIAFAKIIILSSCDSKQNTFIKNEYILDLENLLMTRNFIYDQQTYKKHKITAIHNKVSIIVNKKPSEVGVDPYNKLIDTQSDDNRTKL